MKTTFVTLFALCGWLLLLGFGSQAIAQEWQFGMEIKIPGNPSVYHPLSISQDGHLKSQTELPLRIQLEKSGNEGIQNIKITITALEDTYFHISGSMTLPNSSYENTHFLLPGFWYRKNLRSPENAPSSRVSSDWLVREDRLSTPLSAGFDTSSGKGHFLLRTDHISQLALSPHEHGEVILSGPSDLGAVGFGKKGDNVFLNFSFPYSEAPFSYKRKLTLAPSVKAFHYLKKGESKTLTYRLQQTENEDYSSFVATVWHHSIELMQPAPIEHQKFTDLEIKEILTHYFKSSYMDLGELKGFSGAHMKTETCESIPTLEVGFIGRVLLNAFNALEYGEKYGDEKLVSMARNIFTSYQENGFTPEGWIRENVDFQSMENPDIYSIRRQSEGIYALLLFLKYERAKGKTHPLMEEKILRLLDSFKQLQQKDGSFPRKFRSDLSLVDNTGGSSPSAVPPLVMAYHYFKKQQFLDMARKIAAYQEEYIIRPSDYFSSTLDADCEDKEASLYAATAMYYLAMVSKGKEKARYIAMAKKAAYFTLSWYYTWDVPFAKGQMLGDIGLKSRGWGNVSVENNHIDVFIFEFDEILDWLASETNQKEFSDFAAIIRSSMREQLLPHENHMMGIGKVGYYPEVVQHTAWDYGKNGKGFYNDIFAPGWTVASIWELLTIGRTTGFFNK